MLECWRRGVYRWVGIKHWIAWPNPTNNGLGGRQAVGGEACKRRGSAHNARCRRMWIADGMLGQALQAERWRGRQRQAEAD
jgi:hypothetical protein